MTLNKEESKDSVLYWFISFTSIGGLNQSHLTDWKASKVVWIILFAVGTICTIISVEEAISDYYTYPIVTTLEKKSNDTLDFPAITVCNANRVSCRNLYNQITILNSMNNSANFNVLDALCKIHILGKCYMVLVLNDLRTYGIPKTMPICNSTEPISFSETDPGQVLDSLLSSLPENVYYAIAHQAQDMFKACTYQYYQNSYCYAFMQGTMKYINPIFGVCYSYNYNPPNVVKNWSTENSLKSYMSGETFGLDLEIDVDTGNYLLNGFSPSSGVKIVVHEPTKLPLSSTHGIVVQTNALSKIGLEANEIIRQPPPYQSMCMSKWGNETVLPYDSLPYDDLLCLSFCSDDYVQMTCNCTVNMILKLGRNLSHICGITQEEVACVKMLQAAPERLVKNRCKFCLPQCHEINYEVSLSQMVWPTSYSWPVIAGKYNVSIDYMTLTEDQVFAALTNLTNLNATELSNDLVSRLQRSIQEDYLKVQVYFTTKTVTSVSESPTYTPLSLMNALGGALAFYLGFSIVSLFEVLELLIRMLVHCFNGKCKRKPYSY